MLNSESFVLMSTEFEGASTYITSLFEANPSLVNIEVLLKGINTKLPTNVCAFASVQFEENIPGFSTTMASRYAAIKNGSGSSTPGLPFQCVNSEETQSLAVSGIKVTSLSEDSSSPQWDEMLSMNTWKENYETTSSGIVIQFFQVKPDKDEATTIYIGYSVISFQEIKALGSGISEAGMPIVLDKIKLELNPSFSNTLGDDEMYVTIELRCYSAANYIASLGQPPLSAPLPQVHSSTLIQSPKSDPQEKAPITASLDVSSKIEIPLSTSNTNTPPSRPASSKVPQIVFPKEKEEKKDPIPSLSRSPREKTSSTKSLVTVAAQNSQQFRDSDVAPLVTSVPTVVVPGVASVAVEKPSTPTNNGAMSLNTEKEEETTTPRQQTTTNPSPNGGSPTGSNTPQDPDPKTDVNSVLLDPIMIEKSFFDLDGFTKALLRIQTQMAELVKENMKLEKELKDKRRRPGSRDIGRSGSDEKTKQLTEQLAKKMEMNLTLEKKVVELEKQCKHYQEVAEKSSKEVLHLQKFKTTALKQEEVIEKLESLLTKAVVKSKGYKEVIITLQDEMKRGRSPSSHDHPQPNFEGYGEKNRTGSPFHYGTTRRNTKLQPIGEDQSGKFESPS
jgi:hypothetical protein